MREHEEDRRPNPDLLLKAIQREDEKQSRGKLKIFLGMAAGVGKTFAMLNAAHELVTREVDVVIGLVETHSRKEVEELLVGLHVIPRKIIPYRNVVLEEMDLDAILARHAKVVLVDELAHTNAPGSRHTKRYHDVLEILDTGMDVYTTLNIQHLESLVDTVREITGIPITETIPDSIIDIADEVVLVDLVPEELLKRLQEGKVYAPGQAEQAQHNFFRPGNLAALRELSLRLVAERVNRDLRDYRHVHHITQAWKTQHCLMVAVFASPYSELLIRWTRRMASALEARWYAAHIETDKPASEKEQQLLARNLSLVKELGGETLSTVDDDPVTGLIRLAKENQVTQIVVGKSRRRFLHNLFRGGSVIQRLLKESGNIDIYVVSGEPLNRVEAAVHSASKRLPAFNRRELLIMAAVLAGIGILSNLLNHFIDYRAIGLLFLLGVTVLGVFVRRPTVFLSAFLSGITWDFFFIPPHYTFAISNTNDYMMFIMYFLAAGIVGHLTSRLRLSEEHLRLREQRITALYSLTREIASGKSMHSFLDTAVEQLGSMFEADVAVLLKHRTKGLLEHGCNSLPMDDKEKSVAEWVVQHHRPAGRGTDTLPSAGAFYLPLEALYGAVGVLGLRFHRRQQVRPELMNLIETFARQLALGIEREQLNELSRNALVLQESEKLYKTILNSVSHELKTPLATIEGSASALLDRQVLTQPAAVQELAGEIQEASHRLNRLVKNLLDMTRLESGFASLHREPESIADVITTTLGHLEKEMREHPVSLAIPPDLPMIAVDFLLMEQVFANIFHNAAIHTPLHTSVEVTAEVCSGEMVIAIRDHGPGLPKENPELVFDKFWRSDPAKSGGTGLGLTIAKGWVEAHGGAIQARNHPDGGALFTIRLPLEQPA